MDEKQKKLKQIFIVIKNDLEEKFAACTFIALAFNKYIDPLYVSIADYCKNPQYYINISENFPVCLGFVPDAGPCLCFVDDILHQNNEINQIIHGNTIIDAIIGRFLDKYTERMRFIIASFFITENRAIEHETGYIIHNVLKDLNEEKIVNLLLDPNLPAVLHEYINLRRIYIGLNCNIEPSIFIVNNVKLYGCITPISEIGSILTNRLKQHNNSIEYSAFIFITKYERNAYVEILFLKKRNKNNPELTDSTITKLLEMLKNNEARNISYNKEEKYIKFMLNKSSMKCLVSQIVPPINNADNATADKATLDNATADKTNADNATADKATLDKANADKANADTKINNSKLEDIQTRLNILTEAFKKHIETNEMEIAIINRDNSHMSDIIKQNIKKINELQSRNSAMASEIVKLQNTLNAMYKS